MARPSLSKPAEVNGGQGNYDYAAASSAAVPLQAGSAVALQKNTNVWLRPPPPSGSEGHLQETRERRRVLIGCCRSQDRLAA